MRPPDRSLARVTTRLTVGKQALWWITAILAAAMGASPPQVVEIRVPSAKVSNWFPPGSDIRVLPYDRFEGLVKAARKQPPTPRPHRLLRQTIPPDGNLVGCSEGPN